MKINIPAAIAAITTTNTLGAIALALCITGCGATGAPTFDQVDGASPVEVAESLGVSGSEMPNLSGDGRQLIIYDIDGKQYAGAFDDGKCIGLKELPPGFQMP